MSATLFQWDSEEEMDQILDDLKELRDYGLDLWLKPDGDGIILMFGDHELTSGDIEVKNRLRTLRRERGI